MKKIFSNKKSVIYIFGFAFLLFFLLFTKLMIKTDDGNFLGMAYDPDFTYIGFLKNRYMTLSGRTVSEFLTMFFLRHNIVLWQICSAFLLTYIVWFFCKVSEKISGTSEKKHYIFCCCAPFMMIISCLNPTVFWLSGSFTYLWPFAGMTMCITAPVFCLLDRKINIWLVLLSFCSAPLAAGQEQSAVTTCAIYVIVLLLIFKEKIKKSAVMIIPILPLAVCVLALFSSPGAHNRMDVGTSIGFERFAEMNFFENLVCGLSNFYAQSFVLSAFLLILLAVLMINFAFNEKKSQKLFYILFAAFELVSNAIIIAGSRSMPHNAIRSAFIKNEFTVWDKLFIINGTAVTIILVILLIKVFIRDSKTGLSVGLCLAAGFGCALIMGFSSSIFLSGQRVYFFTEMFIALACAILFSVIPKTKTKEIIFKTAVSYAALMFVIDCFAFRFLELPIMG